MKKAIVKFIAALMLPVFLLSTVSCNKSEVTPVIISSNITPSENLFDYVTITNKIENYINEFRSNIYDKTIEMREKTLFETEPSEGNSINCYLLKNKIIRYEAVYYGSLEKKISNYYYIEDFVLVTNTIVSYDKAITADVNNIGDLYFTSEKYIIKNNKRWDYDEINKKIILSDKSPTDDIYKLNGFIKLFK